MNENQFEPHLTNYYSQFHPYNKFNLYQGEFSIKFNNQNPEKVSGNIDFNYKPNPRIEISFNSNSDIGNDFQNFTTFHPELDISIECLLLKSTDHLQETGTQITALIKSNPQFDETIELINVKFFLVNFPYVLGRPISLEGQIWSGRYKLEVDNWHITIDALRNIKNIQKFLRENNRYAITHLGQIKKVDNQSFSIEELIKQLESLRYSLSFASGNWVTPILIVGFDKNMKKTWECWEGFPVDNYRNIFRWLPLGQVQDLEQFFKGFYKKWNDPDWQEVLNWSIHLYIETNKNSLILEAGIPLQQIALEMLSNFCLNNGKPLKLKNFKNLDAADKIRLLLLNYKINPNIPVELTNLIIIGKEYNWYDGIQAITEVRNSIVHLDITDKNKKAKIREHDVIKEVWTLGQYYLESILLSICDYQGYYINRLKKNIFQDLVGDPFVEAIPKSS
jgi:hypothetical protein